MLLEQINALITGYAIGAFILVLLAGIGKLWERITTDDNPNN